MRNKVITSADGLISIRYDQVRQVCMTGSPYALLQYLLLFDEDMVKCHTCYFLGYGVSRKVSAHLPAVFFDMKQKGAKEGGARIWGKVLARMTKYVQYPFLRQARIFAIDQGFVAPLIGHKSYSLLSDGPLTMQQNMRPDSAEYQRQLRKQHSAQGFVEGFLFGPVAVRALGNNKQCKAFYLTEENDCPVLEGRPVHIKSLRQMWKESSAEKQSLIMRVFDVTEKDAEVLGEREVIFLTQPIVQDCGLSEDEYACLLEQIFSHYGQQNLLLKLHPRDKFDYKRYFPEVAVYDKPVNMQLLALVGAHARCAATICSSSVNSFDESVDVDWYGSRIHPKVEAFFGDAVPPMRSYRQVSLK